MCRRTHTRECCCQTQLTATATSSSTQNTDRARNCMLLLHLPQSLEFAKSGPTPVACVPWTHSVAVLGVRKCVRTRRWLQPIPDSNKSDRMAHPVTAHSRHDAWCSYPAHTAHALPGRREVLHAGSLHARGINASPCLQAGGACMRDRQLFLVPQLANSLVPQLANSL